MLKQPVKKNIVIQQSFRHQGPEIRTGLESGKKSNNEKKGE